MRICVNANEDPECNAAAVRENNVHGRNEAGEFCTRLCRRLDQAGRRASGTLLVTVTIDLR